MGQKYGEGRSGLSWKNCTYLHVDIFSVSHIQRRLHGLYAELGRHPLHISRKITIVKYFQRLSELSDGRLAKKAFKQLSLDDSLNHYNWVSMAKSIISEFSLDVTVPEEKLKNKIRSIYNKTLETALKNCVSQCKKLRTYAKFKTEVKFKNYLNIVNDFKIRRNLIHDLEIERGDMVANLYRLKKDVVSYVLVWWYKL